MQSIFLDHNSFNYNALNGQFKTLIMYAFIVLLMQRFYQFMATDQLTKAEALRQAQLSLLNGETTLDSRFATLGLERGGLVPARESSLPAVTLEHPYYWAPFILIGNHL